MEIQKITRTQNIPPKQSFFVLFDNIFNYKNEQESTLIKGVVTKEGTAPEMTTEKGLFNAGPGNLSRLT